MCMGIPMMIVQSGETFAWCEGMGLRRQVNIQLVGAQPVGTWLLVFLDSAREVLSQDAARAIGDALNAVNLLAQGEPVDPAVIDALFPDLAHREPQLPAHLKPAGQTE